MDFKKNRLKELCKCNHISQEKLADYFDIGPFELFGNFEDAIMPEFKIESSGSIDSARIRWEVLCSLNILAEDKGLIDIYRNIYVEFIQ